MIIFIYGDDNALIANFINGYLKKYTGSDIYRFEGKDANVLSVLDVANSTSLFSKKKLIIIKAKAVKDIEFNEVDLEKLSKDSSQDIIIDASAISQRVKILKLFKKYADIKEFKKKADYTSFNIADALLIENQFKKAIVLFNNIEDVDNAIYGIIGALQYNLRGIISLREGNKLSESFKPFVKQKFSKSTLSDDDLKHLYKALSALDVACKDYKRGRSVKNLFVDFIIDNFAKIDT